MPYITHTLIRLPISVVLSHRKQFLWINHLPRIAHATKIWNVFDVSAISNVLHLFDGFLHHRLWLMRRTQFRQRFSYHSVALAASSSSASTLLDDDVPLGDFLDEQIARVIPILVGHHHYFLVHYCRMLLTRHYDQRPFDETVCEALIANGDVKNRQKRCKTFAMADTSNAVQILVACAMLGIRLIHTNCLRWDRTTETGIRIKVCAIYDI